MELSNIINSIGLFFDIIGAILISIYGITHSINKDGYGGILFNTGDMEEIKKEYKKHKKWSNVGIGLIILGFILQLIGNYL